MATCVPIKDLRDTAAFDELVEKSPTPITVTKNGYDRFVCVRSDEFSRMQQAAAEEKLLARMRIAEYERENHMQEDAFVATERIMKKHGLL